jgi:DNA polymerase III sliding clamp (beta) subunit (PCNA family)
MSTLERQELTEILEQGLEAFKLSGANAPDYEILPDGSVLFHYMPTEELKKYVEQLKHA